MNIVSVITGVMGAAMSSKGSDDAGKIPVESSHLPTNRVIKPTFAKTPRTR